MSTLGVGSVWIAFVWLQHKCAAMVRFDGEMRMQLRWLAVSNLFGHVVLIEK
jgi:hypothetical protein